MIRRGTMGWMGIAAVLCGFAATVAGAQTGLPIGTGLAFARAGICGAG